MLEELFLLQTPILWYVGHRSRFRFVVPAAGLTVLLEMIELSRENLLLLQILISAPRILKIAYFAQVGQPLRLNGTEVRCSSRLLLRYRLAVVAQNHDDY